MPRKPSKKTPQKTRKIRASQKRVSTPKKKEKAAVSNEVRMWGTLPQCLKWLAEEGYTLAEKNAYAHYGPATAAPVKRDAKRRWFFPELLERVRLNRNAPGSDAPSEEIARARLAAELRIKEAQAKTRELHLKKLEGILIEKAAVIEVLSKIKTDFESGRKALVSKLASELHGKSASEFSRVIDAQTWDWLSRMGERIREL